MSLETNSANEIQANWLELNFKLFIIDFVCEPGPETTEHSSDLETFC